MAQSYDRQINLYINIDGQQISNNVKAINAELNKLKNENARATKGSDEYFASASKIKQLKAIMAQHYQDISNVQKGWSFKGMAEGFNKYFGIVASGIATVTGIIYSMNAATKAANDFEAKLANLGAITGLTGNSLEWMGNKAKEMSTSTLEGGIHITKSADDIVDAFTKMGSARPELLKNKEALALVTEKALILAEASKMEMQPAIDAVAASMNQFNLGASEANRIINVLGAGSLEGSAEVADLTESLKNVGTVAASSNMTLEQTVAALEVLGEKQLKGVEGGTKLRGALLKMKEAGVGYTSGQFNMRDALSEVNKKLEAQTSNIEKDALKQKMFGIENITAGDILLQNVDKYDKLTIAVTGTDVAIQQAAKNTATNTALMAQAKSEFHNASIELGKNLSPAMTILYQLAGSVAGAFSKMIATSPAQALEQEGTLVNRLATELANSNTPLERRKVILNEIKEINPKIAEGLDAEKINYKTLTGNIQAYNAELSNRILLENLSENEKKYASKSAKYKEDWASAQIEINKIISQTDQGIALSNATMEEKTTKTLELLKSKAGGVVIAVSGAVADGRNKEAIALLQLQGWIERSTESQKNLNEAQGKQIDFTGRVKSMKEILGIQEDINKVSPIPAAAAGGSIGGSGELSKKDQEEAIKAIEATNAAKMTLIKKRHLDSQSSEEQYNAEVLTQDLKFLNDKAAVYKKGSKEYEEIQVQIQETLLKAGEEGIKVQITQAEAAHSDELARINREHLEGKTSDDQFKADLLTEDLKFLNDKMAIYKVGSKEYEATYNESLTKQVEAQKTVHELLLKAQKELEDAKIDNLDDGIAKEKALEENRWKDELNGLWKQLNNEKTLSADKEALNDTINQTIEEKQAAHIKKMANLTRDGLAENKITDLNDKILHAKTQQEKWDDEAKLAKAQYDQEFAAAQGNRLKELDAEKSYKDKLIGIRTEQNATYKILSEAITSFVSDTFSGQLDQYETFGQSLILMALQILKQLVPIWAAEIVGGSLATPDSIMTGGILGIAKFTAILAIMEGFVSVAEAGVKNNIKKKQEAASKSSSYATGGFTQGETTYIAGEAGQEWISPNWMLKNSVTAPIIAGLERWRRNPVTVSTGALEASRVYSKSNIQSFTSDSSIVNNNTLQSDSTTLDIKELNKAISLNSKAVGLLMKHGVQFPIVTFKKKLDEVSDLLNQTGMTGFTRK